MYACMYVRVNQHLYMIYRYIHVLLRICYDCVYVSVHADRAINIGMYICKTEACPL